MKKEQAFWLLPVQILFFFSIIKNSVSVDGLCLKDQQSYLLQLKNSLKFELQYSTKLVQWNPDEDCCGWRGVACDASGRVTTLELNDESIASAADNLTRLFRLQFLEKLNLRGNYFKNMSIPKAIANLTNLVYLNLSESGFVGQIPIELSSLRKLVSLDLSTLDQVQMQVKLQNPSVNITKLQMKMEKPTLKMLLQNLSNIEEIYLDGVDLSTQGNEWSQVIGTSLPKLRVLSLRNCYISGPIDISLSSIPSLSDIFLDFNNMSTEVPEFLANMPNLTTLSLSGCDLLGQFPIKILQVPTLQTLDISYNKLLHGWLPPFPDNSSLRTIVVRSTSFSGSLSNSFGNLHMLSKIDLSSCNFSGTMPQLQSSNNLVYLDISYNSLSGSLSSDHFKGLQSLVSLHLSYNSFSGRIPSSLFLLPELGSIELSNNQFSGQIDEIPNGLSMSMIYHVDLGSNQLNGSFPKFLFELKALKELILSSNFFSDTIRFETFKFPNLVGLDLSYNNLTVEVESYNSSLAKITWLMLASCKVKTFPEMKNNMRLDYLDLSDNEITGEIPNWIWDLNLFYLNLSLNSFSGLQHPYNISTLSPLQILDLHSNQLKGELPISSSYFTHVDFSKNKFSGPIPLELKANLFMSLSDNSLTGSIPDSICSKIPNFFSGLAFLDLSNNALSGTIPSCLVSISDTLKLLNLTGNNLNGSIPDTFPSNCSLKTLELSMNKLQGKLPRSLSDCTMLEVLNLRNNNIEDVFPCMFMNSPNLHVLMLRSNNFHGELECFGYNHSWSQLQIIDIAFNNFSGALSSQFFSSLKTMLTINRADYLRFQISEYMSLDVYHQFKVTMKGHETQLEKILTIFTAIDFSNNKLSGNIPESIGDLKALYILDLSHNEITGGIPSTIGKLSNLGSIDLSKNQLSGEVPSALQDLTFLTYLNFSFNMLIGKIPSGSQLQTFPNDSYIGNAGLCGFPLNVSCGDPNDNGSSSIPSLNNNKEINWMYVCVSVGYTMGLGIFSIFLLFCTTWRNKLFLRVEQFQIKVFGPQWREPIRRL